MAAPRLLQQGSGQSSGIYSGYHRYRLVERLQETPNRSLLTCPDDIPPTLFHKSGRMQKRDWHRWIAERLLANQCAGSAGWAEWPALRWWKDKPLAPDAPVFSAERQRCSTARAPRNPRLLAKPRREHATSRTGPTMM